MTPNRPASCRRRRAVRLAASLVVGLGAVAMSTAAAAQIVNVEPHVSKELEPAPLSGRLDLSLEVRTGNVELLRGRLNGGLTFTDGPHRVLALASGDLAYKGGYSDDDRFLAAAFGHLRWQAEIWQSDARLPQGAATADAESGGLEGAGAPLMLLRWETFAQLALDEIRRNRARVLAGTGARLELRLAETFEMTVGLGAFFEHIAEEVVVAGTPEDLETVVDEQIVRLSAYLAIRWEPSEVLSLTHTTYAQPNLGPMPSDGSRDPFVDDVRVLSQTYVSVRVGGPFHVFAALDITWDSAPPRPIDPLDLATRVGLGLAL